MIRIDILPSEAGFSPGKGVDIPLRLSKKTNTRLTKTNTRYFQVSDGKTIKCSANW